MHSFLYRNAIIIPPIIKSIKVYLILNIKKYIVFKIIFSLSGIKKLKLLKENISEFVCGGVVFCAFFPINKKIKGSEKARHK